MGRATAQTHLALDFDALAAAANVPDASALYGASLDSAYAVLGFTDADLPDPALTSDQAQDLVSLADYLVLQSISRTAGALVDVVTGPEQQRLGQVYAHAVQLAAQAQAQVEARGYGMANVISAQRITLDFLEPGPFLGGGP